MTITSDRFKELLAKVKAAANQKKDTEHVKAISTLEATIQRNKPDVVDLTAAGISSDSLATEEGREEAKDVIAEITAPSSKIQHTREVTKKTGVAADVTLNKQQQEFVDTVLSGEDVVLVGAAGTGKTTATGKAIAALQKSGQLEPLGTETKWLREKVPGILIVSFTRKAVNNIRRATPPELRPHVLTIHKVLEFEPVFYDILDEKTGNTKTTMKFEPKRGKFNPLPSGITHVVYEESSMIGVDLYNMLADALPHRPQEIFLGDIRQLPPIFGPAILGFKMSLLPVVELTEVYRQALLSPIIRLAHGILSGDARKFSPAVEERKEKHPATGNVVTRKYVKSLEAFNEEGEHGTVKFQPWQKKLSSEDAVETITKQLIHWHKTGYYNPEEDVIMIPFNKSFGTVEINKKLHNYLGQQRGATVHEVIAGFEKHYLAVGDRVMYDKEDAVITDIKRNLSYLGKPVQPPSIYLDRWGTLQKPLTEEEKQKFVDEEGEFNLDAIDKFIESFSGEGDKDDRVNQASHSIEIRFSHSDEVQTLSGAGEVNNLIGGNAITVHKLQGSEAERCFLLLHNSHQAMCSNELLYTAVTRARSFLHIVCEVDTFFKGVKTHKVRGVTIKDKIDSFKGKVEFKQMQEELELIKKQKEERDRLKKARVRWKLEDQEKEKFTENFLFPRLEITNEYFTRENMLFDQEYDNLLPEQGIEIIYDDWKDYQEEIQRQTSPAPTLSAAEKLAAIRARLRK